MSIAKGLMVVFVFKGGAMAGHVACLSSLTQGKVRLGLKLCMFICLCVCVSPFLLCATLLLLEIPLDTKLCYFCLNFTVFNLFHIVNRSASKKLPAFLGYITMYSTVHVY